MGQYVGVFVLVFIAALLAMVVTGSLATKKLHIGIPDQ